MAGPFIQRILTVALMTRWLGGGVGLLAETWPDIPAAQTTHLPAATVRATPVEQDWRLFDRPEPSAVGPAAEPDNQEIRLPDLRGLPPFDLHLKRIRHNRQADRTYLRFAVSFWNAGQGTLELRGVFNPESRQTQVWQSLYAADDTSSEYLAGEFIWHPGHEHWHFGDFAVYELWSLSPDGALGQVVSGSGKVTFCILETHVVARHWPGFSPQARYIVCGPGLQGLSVGWGDTYKAGLEGQEIDITSVPDGVYALVVTLDPANRIMEANDANNTAVTYLELAGKRLRVLEGKEQLYMALGLCLRLC